MGRGRKGVLVQSKQKADHNGENAYNIKQPRTVEREQVFISGAVMEQLKNLNPAALSALLLNKQSSVTFSEKQEVVRGFPAAAYQIDLEKQRSQQKKNF